jgi:hypothetical protein
VVDTQEDMPQPEPESLRSAIASGQYQPIDETGYAKQGEKENGYPVDQPKSVHVFSAQEKLPLFRERIRTAAFAKGQEVGLTVRRAETLNSETGSEEKFQGTRHL